MASSPSSHAGIDRSKALNLSAVSAIVLLSIFIKTLPALEVKVDVLPFAIICLVYFMVASLLVALYLRFLGNSSSQTISLEADSHAFVLGFNIVALLSFALFVEIAISLNLAKS